MVFQNYALYPHMTVLQEHRVPAADRQEAEGRDRGGRPARGGDPRARGAAAPLCRASSRAGSGSASRSRARSCASRDAFLMDEPLSNLDAQLRIQTRLELIQLHQRLGITTMYVTHDQVEAMTMGAPDRGDERRRAAADRDAAGRLPPAGERLRRDVPRRAADEPDRRRARVRAAAAGASAGRTSTCRSRPRCSARRSWSTRSRRSGEVKLGLRPEHFRLGPPGQDGGIAGRRAVPRAGRLGSLPHGRGRRHDRPGAHRPRRDACSRTTT